MTPDVGPIRRTLITANHPPLGPCLRGIYFLSIVIVFMGGVPAAHAEVQVGAAVRVITPSPLLPISGGGGGSGFAPAGSGKTRGDHGSRPGRPQRRGHDCGRVT